MERTVSITCVAAIGLWFLTFGFIFAGTVVGIVGGGGELPVALALMAHGLAFSAAAATASIRMMIRKQNRMLREAFDHGRDVAGPVRSVRP